MKIGVTLLFKEKQINTIKGVLKSTVVDFYSNNLIESTKIISNKIKDYYNYEYLGINDLFVVSGDPERGELLGRNTYYELDSLNKAKSLLPNDDYSLDRDTVSSTFNCSIVYFCENNDGEKFAISILSIVNSSLENLIPEIESLANSIDFVQKIKSNSLENLKKIDFIGIEDICEVDLKFNVFQSFYSDFNSEEDLEDELMSSKEIKDVLDDIIADW